MDQPAAIPPFVAGGTVSIWVFQGETTNSIRVVDANFIFSYTNQEWEIEVSYPKATASGNGKAVDRINCRSIPDGIRTIVSFPQEPNESQATNRNGPYATAEPGYFPSPKRLELFLPWLALYPNPILPKADPDHIREDFSPELLNNPTNIGTYHAAYIRPYLFLSELAITNNGYLFTDQGPIRNRHPYENGYLHRNYKVLSTTNIGGVEVPLSSEWTLYAPSPPYSSAADLSPILVAQLEVLRVDLEHHSFGPKPAPTWYVALDSRSPLFANGGHANYDITNDQWPALTNAQLQTIVAFFSKQRPAGTVPDRMNTKTRIVYFSVIGASNSHFDFLIGRGERR